MKTLVIGSCALDVYVQLPHLPVLGEDVNSRDLQMSLGGMAYNVYHVMKLLGTEPILGCPVGQGVRAEIVTGLLQKQGDQPIGVIPGLDNGICLCLVDDSRERSFISHHGAEYRFDPRQFRHLDFNTIDWIYASGLEIEDWDGEQIVSFLEAKQKPLFFAPGPRLEHIPHPLMERLLFLHPVLHLNEREAALLSGENNPDHNVELLCSRTQNAVIITLGARGALLKQPGSAVRFLPAEKAAMVDSTGAGDNHAGAVLAGISRGMAYEDAVRRANFISACAVQQKGAVLSRENFDRAMDAWRSESKKSTNQTNA